LWLSRLQWSRLPELNRRPSNYESDALPTELSRLNEAFEIYECSICSVKPKKIGPAGGIMPKDATKNIDRYKIRGGQLNEFDFHQNQEQFAEQNTSSEANLIPGTPPEARALNQRATKTTRAGKATKSTKGTKSAKAKKATKAKKAAPRGATAKKLAARKAARKNLKATKTTRKAAKKK
jgi:hypothetical protein